MTDPNKAQARWAMPFDELAVSIGDGQPGSPDWEHGVAVLNARIAVEQAKTALWTRRLVIATWALAAITLAFAIVTTIAAS